MYKFINEQAFYLSILSIVMRTQISYTKAIKPNETTKQTEVLTMHIYTNFSDFEPWSDAVEIWNKIKDADKLDDFEVELDLIYPDGMSETKLNDLLRFDSEWCLELVGLDNDEDEEEEDDEECFELFCNHFSKCEKCPLNYCITQDECKAEISKNPSVYLNAIKDMDADEYLYIN